MKGVEDQSNSELREEYNEESLPIAIDHVKEAYNRENRRFQDIGSKASRLVALSTGLILLFGTIYETSGGLFAALGLLVSSSVSIYIIYRASEIYQLKLVTQPVAEYDEIYSYLEKMPTSLQDQIYLEYRVALEDIRDKIETKTKTLESIQKWFKYGLLALGVSGLLTLVINSCIELFKVVC